MEGRAEVAEGPEVLEVRRLVEQPGRRPARPAVPLEIVLAVEEALEERAAPVLAVEVRGELARRLGEGAAVVGSEGAVGPVIAVIVRLDRGGPVLVERE